MDNFELHNAATNLEDAHTPYQLAKKLLLLGEAYDKLEQELLEERKKSAYLSQLRPHSVTEKELTRHDLYVAADALEEQAEAYAKQQTQRISWELQDEADLLREKAENMT